MELNNTEKIRILVISDLYPPYYRGGYELMTKFTNDLLVKHGFEFRILTSDYKVNKKTIDGNVYRIFDYNFGGKSNFIKSLYLQIVNISRLKKQISDFNPQAILISHPTFLSKTVLSYLDSIDIPIIYYLQDSWLIWWYFNQEQNSWFSYFEPGNNKIKNIIKAALKRICAPFVSVNWKPIKPSFAVFVSNSLKQMHLDENFPMESCPVVHNRLQLDNYSLVPVQRNNKDTFNMIWSGRIARYKGTHIAIEAVSILVNEQNIKNIKLSIFGEAESQEYLEHLLETIQTNKLEQYVELKESIAHSEMIKEYEKYDICLFTSIYKEPFGLVWLEAMASGVPVIGTITGGSREIFIDNENALIYNEKDPNDLANKIIKLMTDQTLYRNIQNNAIKLVKEKFDIELTVEELAKYYKSVLEKEIRENE